VLRFAHLLELRRHDRATVPIARSGFVRFDAPRLSASKSRFHQGPERSMVTCVWFASG
jgi:hypothetical protein